MNQTKICALLALDEDTQELCMEITSAMKVLYSGRVVCKPESLLPHTSLLAGIKARDSEVSDVVQKIRREVRVFYDTRCLPHVGYIDASQRNGNILAIRLFFTGRSPHFLTGSWKKDQELITELCPTFVRDEHISLARVEGGYKEFDFVFPSFREICNKHHEALIQMQFTPQIWVKPDGGRWHPYEH